MEFSNFSDLFPEGTPPPPPPMFGSPIQESLAEKQIEVCEPLTYLDNDVCSGHPDCVGSDCSDDVWTLKLLIGNYFITCYYLG